MKALKIAGIVLLIIAIVFFSLGIFIPFYEYQSSIEVNAPPEKCWKVFHNTSLMDQWLPGFESLTLKAGDTLAIGSSYEIVVNDHHKRMIMLEKITGVIAPSSISYELNNDVLKSEYSYSFEGSSSTKISGHFKITGNNIVWKSILILSKSYMTSSSQNQLSLLKKVIEQQP